MNKSIHLWAAMYIIFIIFLLTFVTSATAQEQEPPPPPELPELQIEPPETADSFLDEPLVIIRKRGEEKIEEYRIDGRTHVIKVTPRIGFPYYLYDDTGDASYSNDGVLDDGIRPPMWKIFEF